jgi:hypothetical protein
MAIEDVQVKSIGNIFNKIIAEHFPKLKRCPSKNRRHLGFQTDTTKIEPLHSLSTENKERILKSTYNSKPIRIIISQWKT